MTADTKQHDKGSGLLRVNKPFMTEYKGSYRDPNISSKGKSIYPVVHSKGGKKVNRSKNDRVKLPSIHEKKYQIIVGLGFNLLKLSNILSTKLKRYHTQSQNCLMRPHLLLSLEC